MTLASWKGGVGKSTLAVHLAGCLARRDKRVVLLDEDERVGSGARWASRGETLGFEVLRPEDVKPKKLRNVDFVVIDTPGRGGLRKLRETLKRTDVLLVPTGPWVTELDATRSMVEALRPHAEFEKVSCVIARAPAVGGAGKRARDALSREGVSVASTIIRAYNAYLTAAERGCLACDVRGGASAWSDVSALTSELFSA
ncbi:plasmid segregation oscillating ATPase ParF [Deinococcus yavapaiensis KR-236]|uniref:Plasmid segregation oscillating ATPase ParF n=1 Tax=Deinococcus yavapaiensis KR-236 TaxID=694435 RepID=A0A318SGD9_9DEIO|nr:plasmid segregation oscillating ATPase ParF [Deinococcus yavapaiensis KR-236]